MDSKKIEENWREKVTENLDYYTKSDEGRKELSEMLKREEEILQEDIKSRKRRVKDIVWLSRFCSICTQFIKRGNNHIRCAKLNARIVKPFYGKALWGAILNDDGDKEMLIIGFNWNLKAVDIPDDLIDSAISTINNGYPYACFEPKT